MTGDNLLQGMHTVLTLRPQAMDPTTDANHVAIYNKLDASSVPELFYAPNSAQTPIQLTYPSVSTVVTQLQQYSFVAGPFVVYAGRVNGLTPTMNNTTVILSPTTTLIYVGLTIARQNIGSINPFIVTATSVTGSQFNITFAPFHSGSMDVYYIAVGK